MGLRLGGLVGPGSLAVVVGCFRSPLVSSPAPWLPCREALTAICPVAAPCCAIIASWPAVMPRLGLPPTPSSGTAAARPCGSGPPFGPRFVCFWHRRTARLRPLSPVPGGPRSIVWHSARSGGSPASIGCRVAVGAPPTPPEWTAPTVAVARLAPCPLPRVAGLARRAGCKLVTHRTGLRGRCPL